MLASPTVLVLGAGSGVDFGMPTGPTLAEDIRRRLSFDAGGGDSVLRAILSATPSNFATARVIAQGLPSFKSIDDFLFSHSDDEKAISIGKLAIVRSISAFERASFVAKLWSSEDSVVAEAYLQIRSTWAKHLIELVVTGLRRADAARLFNNLSIISFNYDRCLESILYHAIQPALNLSKQAAMGALTALRVYRPYGGLGLLQLPGSQGVPYAPDDPGLVDLAKSIRVYTEQMDERPDLVEMRTTLEKAKTTIFLGFGFHQQNMNILNLNFTESRSKAGIYATTFGESGPAVETIKERIERSLRPGFLRLGNPSIDGCAKFMSDYQTKFFG